MKKMVLLWMAAILLLAAGTAMAAGTANVNVTATVLGTCQFSTVPSLDFGNLDPATGGAVNPAPVNLTFNCTKDVNFTLADDKGGVAGSLSSNLVNGVNTIPYSLVYTNDTGLGLGGGVANEITSVLTGAIAANTYDNAPAGVYTDTIVFTINP